jgi:hypothetical protein
MMIARRGVPVGSAALQEKSMQQAKSAARLKNAARLASRKFNLNKK